jgi:hypothetical protein
MHFITTCSVQKTYQAWGCKGGHDILYLGGE